MFAQRPALALVVALVVFAVFDLPAHAASAVRKAPPYTAFWQAAPVQEPDTLFLWQLDDKAAAGAELLDEPVPEATPEEDTAGADSFLKSGSATAVPELRGGVKLAPEGRFGGGARLDGTGALVASSQIGRAHV